ncbi:PAS domain S-box-containing protein [Anaerovirgula multivorans]|uniref:histidine kinase n=1 Tax=Anaerovirgula multivorans TaxID=312168 RepID=A0A239CFB1_9FIRM|nr:PocR ligand-binding domain-containing protein [Anaerovirgula multivorans]SNS18351.1 PAS domain S-box-containing protein [Anaerovirgula multivorans]
MEYKFTDLVDISKIQELTNLFYKATGILTATLDLEGNILTASGWREICTKFHRANLKSRSRCIESDTHISKMLVDNKNYRIYKCQNGLIDAVAPVVVQGKHIANIFTGQLLLDKPDLGFFIKQAKEFGFNESEYVKVLLEVPVIEEERLKHIMCYLCSFAEILGEMGLKELKLLESQAEVYAANEDLEASQKMLIATLEELRDQYDKLQQKENLTRENEKRWKYAIEGTDQIVWDWNIENNQVYFSKAYKSLLGFEANEFIGDTKEYLNRIHPDDRKGVMEEMTKYLNGNIIFYHNEYRIKDRDGNYKWIVSKGQITERNHEDKPIRIVGTLTDITTNSQKP